jgi:transposase-like protein
MHQGFGLPGDRVPDGYSDRHHPDSCVMKRLFKEGMLRGYYRHRQFLWNSSLIFTVRHGPQTDATMILTALGVDLEGSREVLAFRACAEEDKDGWSCLLDEEHLLTFYAFPPVMHRYIRSTNAIESLFSTVRRRTDQLDAFTTETSCLTIVWAVMQDIRLPKIPVG